VQTLWNLGEAVFIWCGIAVDKASDPLVLVPGIDGTALLFYRQVPLLAKRFRVSTFPLPDQSDCTMASLVDALHEHCRRVAGARGVTLCGESFGGALSLSYALSHPDMLRRLVIVNSFPVIRQRAGLRLARLLLKAVPWGTMNLARRFSGRRLHSPHTRPEDLSEYRERVRAGSRTGYIRRLEILRRYDIRERLERIVTPTLFLASDRDHVVPAVPEARYMAARMPRATVKILEGHGHICLINHELDLLEEITSWIDGGEAEERSALKRAAGPPSA